MPMTTDVRKEITLPEFQPKVLKNADEPDTIGFAPVARVPNRFFGIRDLAYLKTGNQNYRGKGEVKGRERFGIVIMNGMRD